MLNHQAINFKVPNDDVEERQNFDSDTDVIGCEAKEEIGFSSNFLLNQKYDKLGDRSNPKYNNSNFVVYAILT